MVKLFSINSGVFLNNYQNSEAQLNHFLSKNWKNFFPQYIFIKSEFPLSGIVRTTGSSGRVDIFAFNPISNKFVVFELKRDFSRNIRSQAEDYRHTINRDFHKIYNDCIDEYDAHLPRPKVIVQDSIEIVLIANTFSSTDIEIANKFKDEITLIRYSWFENSLFFIEYLNNSSIFLANSVIDAKQKVNQRNEFAKQIPKIEAIIPNIAQEPINEIYTLQNRNFSAKGYESGAGKEFVVLKGSEISLTHTTNNISDNENELRNRFLSDGTIVDGKFTKDIPFTSKSQAAKVILGYSVSGNVVWKR